MCMLIISDRWKNEGVCMWLLRCMQDTFLELDTSINDEPVQGKINKPISLHIVGVSNKKTLSAHARELKMRKWVTFGLRPLQAS